MDAHLDAHADTISSIHKKNRGLCYAIIFGTLRHREYLDWVIRAFSSTPLKKIHLKALYLLRTALFQILYLDRVPVFAAINTAVEIAKKETGKKISGFVNAVLRNCAKNHAAVSLPDKIRHPSNYISVHYSLPLWLSRKWMNTYGFDAACALCRQINAIPPITIRTNTLKAERQLLFNELFEHAARIEKTRYACDGIRLFSPGIRIQELEAFKLGLFQVQDEAAQIATELLSPEPGEKVLDACAGLGGKTGHIAQLMANKGIIIAADLEGHKLDALDLEAKRLGIDIVQTKPMNLLKTSIKDFDGYFDRVLIDAPCSGLGVLRRNPDTKWKRTKKDIFRLAGKQKKMLNAAANLVKPSGTLVYAVCSCEKEENQDVIFSFLNKRKDFSIDKDFQSDTNSVLMTEDGFFKTYPGLHDMDGFFAARLKRIQKNK